MKQGNTIPSYMDGVAMDSVKSCQILSELERYMYDIQLACPYGMPLEAVYRQTRFETMPDDFMGFLLSCGFRRNGNFVYIMRCRSCDACVPIRLNPEEFTANRNQKRVLKRNEDVETEIAPLQMSKENLALLDKFLKSRYPGHSSVAEEYYAGFFLNTFGSSFEIRYRVNGRLIGVAINDVGTQWLNAVYYYFDPDEGKRSPGTYNILNLIDFCREYEMEHLYLGYWIESVKAMCYKGAFKPHYLLRNGGWQPVRP